MVLLGAEAFTSAWEILSMGQVGVPYQAFQDPQDPNVLVHLLSEMSCRAPLLFCSGDRNVDPPEGRAKGRL